MTNWQPIETAPKDGTRILIFVPWQNSDAHFGQYKYADTDGSEQIEFYAGVHAARFDSGFDGWVMGQDYWSDDAMVFRYDYEKPTHWAPLPEPPQRS